MILKVIDLNDKIWNVFCIFGDIFFCIFKNAKYGRITKKQYVLIFHSKLMIHLVAIRLVEAIVFEITADINSGTHQLLCTLVSMSIRIQLDTKNHRSWWNHQTKCPKGNRFLISTRKPFLSTFHVPAFLGPIIRIKL